MELIEKLALEGPLRVLLTDIDDTLTDNGKLGPQAYTALWNLAKRGIAVIAVTGRPAGWCEMIARQWPVHGVVGENGALYFSYQKREMKRVYAIDEEKRASYRHLLNELKGKILSQVPGCALASDQFARLFDLAIDFCEDVDPLPLAAAEKIKEIFEGAGATAKISSIHVNGWFGRYDKLTMCQKVLSEEFSLNQEQQKQSCLYVGDSPNDEPLFQYFPLSVGVANIVQFKSQLIHLPKYVTQLEGGRGFAQLTSQIESLC